MKKYIVYIIMIMFCVLLYIPFKFWANKYNIVSMAYLLPDGGNQSSNNFYYLWSVFLWPTFFGITSMVLFYISVRFIRERKVYLLNFLFLIFLYVLLPYMDSLFKMNGYGSVGYDSWETSLADIGTQQVSVILIPIFCFFGAISGVFIILFKVQDKLFD